MSDTQAQITDPARDYWLVTIESRKTRRVIGGAPDADEAMALADDEAKRLRRAFRDPNHPFDTWANNSRHARLADGRVLVCYPPNKIVQPVWVGISDGPSGVFTTGVWADLDTAKRETREVADPENTLGSWRDDGQAGWVADSETAEGALYVQSAAAALS